MKKIFTLLAFCLPLFAIGQGIELDPADDVYYEHVVNDWADDKINIKNISGVTLTLRYETLSNTFLEDWTSTFCAGVNCYNYIPTSGPIGDIEDGEETFLNCSMGFWEYVGEGTVVFRIYDENDATIADTISVTYNVSESTGTNDLVNDYNFRLSPNPTQGELFIQNDQLEEYEVKIYSLTGQLILNEKVTGKNWVGDLSNQNDGMYILTIVSENGLAFREKVIKN